MLKYRKTTKLYTKSYKIYNIGTMHIFKYNQPINTLRLYNRKTIQKIGGESIENANRKKYKKYI